MNLLDGEGLDRKCWYNIGEAEKETEFKITLPATSSPQPAMVSVYKNSWSGQVKTQVIQAWQLCLQRPNKLFNSVSKLKHKVTLHTALSPIYGHALKYTSN